MLSPQDESTARFRISPAEAKRRAEPYLEKVFRMRCERRADKHWCHKKTGDFVVLLGDYYHVARESYPYKTLQAYLSPAVKVHRETGEVIWPAD